MRTLLRTLTVAALLVLPASAAHAQVSFGIRIGPPPAPHAYRVPRQPGPNYMWIEGYWYPQGARYHWRNGYWSRPPYPGAYWVAPYYVRGQYFSGHWEGRRDDRRYDRRDDRRNDRRYDDRDYRDPYRRR